MIKCVIPCLFIVLLSFSSLAQSPDPLIQNVSAREKQSLDGAWRIIVDPLENGYYNHRYQPKDNGYFENAQMQSPSDLIEYNFETSEQLTVPGDWNTQAEKLYYYEGTVWYKRSFDYEKQDNERVFLYFGAVNYDAKVYLNGEKIGEHIGGYTPFNFEVTDRLKAEDNFVVVKVDNTRQRDAVPTINFDWWNYGGLTRSVYLVKTPATFIQDYFVQLAKGSQQEVAGWVQLSDSVRQEVTVSIPELDISKTFSTDAQGRVPVRLQGNFTLWSPDNPKTYRVVVKSATDQVEDQIAFRTIKTKGHQVLLNGSPIFLKGVCVHEEAPFGPGRVTTREECEVLIGWAKEMGCNFVRLAHYPHSEEMIRVAEENGVMVWSEIPVYWTVMFDNPDIYANAEQQLTEMISRDKNRGAIILWSVANETPVSDARVTFLSNLVRKTKSLDSTRLTTAALETHASEEGFRMIDDPLGAYIDVIGINQYCGWYEGKPVDCADRKWKIAYDKPLIISEFGGGSLQGYHGADNERWTEEYQDAVYESNLEMMDNIDFLAGTTPWLLKDFLSPRRPLPNIQDDYNRKGLISEQGVKKKAFHRLQKYYQTKSPAKSTP